MSTFADLTDQQLRMLAGTLQVQFAGLARDVVMQNLTNAHAAINDNAVIATVLNAAQTQNFAQALGLSHAGSRAQMVARIIADAINPDDQAVLQPRDLSFMTLDTLFDRVKFDDWWADIRTKMGTRGCWTNMLESQINGVVINPTPYQQQQLLLAFAGVKNSLSDCIRKQMNGENPANAAQIMLWVRRKVTQEMADVLENKALAKLGSLNWRDSGGELASWVAVLKSVAAQCGDDLPVGRPRDKRIRDLIIKNVKETDPECMQIVREYKRHAVVAQGFGVDDLVRDLTAVMIASETDGEKQCQVFAAEIMTESEMKDEINALIAEKSRVESAKSKAENAAKKALQEKNAAESAKKSVEQAFFTAKGVGKGPGNPKHAHGNGEQKSKTGKFCHICAKWFESKGLKDKKDSVIRNHNTAECKFNTKKQHAPNKTVRKTDAKAKGKGKFGSAR